MAATTRSRRFLEVLAASLALGLIAPGAARIAPAQEPGADVPALVLWYGPAELPARAAAARAAVERFASRHRAGFIDLSPRPLPAPTAAAELGRGIEAYRGFEYDEALDHLTRGLDEVARTGAAGLTTSELSDLLIHRALVFAQRGDATRSWDDFVAAATVDATRKLDPVRYSPRIVETFARATAAVQGGSFARTAVAVADACEVHIDGHRVTPGEARLLAYGQHYVRIACAGFAPYGGVLLAQQPEQTLTPALRPLAPPDEAGILALARGRGAAEVAFVRVVDPGSPAATVVVRWIDVPGGRDRDRVAVVLGDSAGDGSDVGAGDAGTRTARALGGLLAATRSASAEREPPPATPISLEPPPPPARPWYRQPWVWGVAGFALAAAILAPLAFDTSSATGFEVRPGGDLPPRR